MFYCHRGRHPVLMWVKTGWTKDGQIAGMDFKSYVDGGAYTSYGAASLYYTGALQAVCEHLPAYRWQGVRVLTNKPPCGPKRGHGTPQPRYALECHFDTVAERLGIPVLELRRKNFLEPNSKTVNHLRITSNGLRECVDIVARESEFDASHGKLRVRQRAGLRGRRRTCVARACRCTGTTCPTARSTSASIAAAR